MPLGLFGSAALGSQRAAAVVVVAIGVALSTGLELAQAFVFSRTASIIDIGAETCGTAAGVALWHVLGARIEPAVVSLNEFLTRTTTLDRLVLVYLAGLSGLWLAPFDFTIRPSELVEKYERLHMLLPFSPSPDAATATELGLMAAVAIPAGMAGVVIAAWWRTRAGVISGLVVGICWMAMLTCAQVFVASRTTDSTLVVAALPGLALGASLGARGARGSTNAPHAPNAPNAPR